MICRSKRVSLLALREPARPPAKLCLSVFLNELVSEGGLVYTASRWTVDRTTHTLPFRLAKWLATRTHSRLHSHLHSHAHTFFPHRAPHVMSNMHTHIRQAWLSWEHRILCIW